MGYFKENISEILSFLFLIGFLVWFLIEPLENFQERRRIQKRDSERQENSNHFKLIDLLIKEKRYDEAKKLMEAPKDKHGNYCRFDHKTGEWLQRNKNGTWSQYRP